MRHRKKFRKLSRTAAHRRALFRNLVSALFVHGSIKTTDAKAKELKRRADRLIAMAVRCEKGNRGLHARRSLAREVFGAEPIKALYQRWLPGLMNRDSGYVRIAKVGRRLGDGAPVSVVQIIGADMVATGEGQGEEVESGGG